MTINNIWYKWSAAAIGSPEEDRATDTTSPWSQIALLKGILHNTGIAADTAGHIDNTAFTPGDDVTVPAGGIYRSTRDAVNDGDAGALAMNAKRGLYVSPESPNGDSIVDDTNDAMKVIHSTADTMIGSLTETAPATDTASSGLNGRLQRIAQRLTSLIAQVPATLGVKARTASLSVAMSTEDAALFPASVGSKAAAASFAVTDSTEDIARVGIITETAPASDTASSGLNGRLQRIAQRITSLIALVPASLGQKAMSASMAVTLASDDPLTVLQSASAATVTALASSATSAQLLASTPARKGLMLVNTDANAVLVKYGTTASATSYTVRLVLNAYWEMPRPIYTGRIDAIWEADGAGSLIATEL